MRGFKAPAEERFEEKARVAPCPGLSEPCWLWEGAKDAFGSGLFWDGERTVVAHRWSYQNYIGPIPPKHVVRQRCHLRYCVSPHHLISGERGYV